MSYNVNFMGRPTVNVEPNSRITINIPFSGIVNNNSGVSATSASPSIAINLDRIANTIFVQTAVANKSAPPLSKCKIDLWMKEVLAKVWQLISRIIIRLVIKLKLGNVKPDSVYNPTMAAPAVKPSAPATTTTTTTTTTSATTATATMPSAVIPISVSARLNVDKTGNSYSQNQIVPIISRSSAPQSDQKLLGRIEQKHNQANPADCPSVQVKDKMKAQASDPRAQAHMLMEEGLLNVVDDYFLEQDSLTDRDIWVLMSRLSPFADDYRHAFNSAIDHIAGHIKGLYESGKIDLEKAIDLTDALLDDVSVKNKWVNKELPILDALAAELQAAAPQDENLDKIESARFDMQQKIRNLLLGHSFTHEELQQLLNSLVSLTEGRDSELNFAIQELLSTMGERHKAELLPAGAAKAFFSALYNHPVIGPHIASNHEAFRICTSLVEVVNGEIANQQVADKLDLYLDLAGKRELLTPALRRELHDKIGQSLREFSEGQECHEFLSNDGIAQKYHRLFDLYESEASIDVNDQLDVFLGWLAGEDGVAAGPQSQFCAQYTNDAALQRHVRKVLEEFLNKFLPGQEYHYALGNEELNSKYQRLYDVYEDIADAEDAGEVDAGQVNIAKPRASDTWGEVDEELDEAFDMVEGCEEASPILQKRIAEYLAPLLAQFDAEREYHAALTDPIIEDKYHRLFDLYDTITQKLQGAVSSELSVDGALVEDEALNSELNVSASWQELDAELNEAFLMADGYEEVSPELQQQIAEYLGALLAKFNGNDADEGEYNIGLADPIINEKYQQLYDIYDAIAQKLQGEVNSTLSVGRESVDGELNVVAPMVSEYWQELDEELDDAFLMADGYKEISPELQQQIAEYLHPILAKFNVDREYNVALGDPVIEAKYQQLYDIYDAITQQLPLGVVNDSGEGINGLSDDDELPALIPVSEDSDDSDLPDLIPVSEDSDDSDLLDLIPLSEDFLKTMVKKASQSEVISANTLNSGSKSTNGFASKVKNGVNGAKSAVSNLHSDLIRLAKEKIRRRESVDTFESKIKQKHTKDSPYKHLGEWAQQEIGRLAHLRQVYSGLKHKLEKLKLEKNQIDNLIEQKHSQLQGQLSADEREKIADSIAKREAQSAELAKKIENLTSSSEEMEKACDVPAEVSFLNHINAQIKAIKEGHIQAPAAENSEEDSFWIEKPIA